MSTSFLDSAPAAEAEAAPRPFRWSHERYLQAFEAGVFGPEARVELIDGEVVEMSPQYSPHATALFLVEDAIRDAFDARLFHVRTQVPLDLGNRSQPEPAVAVVRGKIRDYVKAHPTTAELVVEISDSTLKFDQTKKLALYAQAGIPEYWIVNLVESVVEVYRDPRGATYGSKSTYAAGDAMAPLVAPETTVAVSDLLP